MSSINVTPFVDVMLVLLIVFMITAPLLTVGVPVDLPKTQAGQLNADSNPLIVTLNKDGLIYIQEIKVKKEELLIRLKAISGINKKSRIFVRGDSNILYGEVLKLMGIIQAAGYERVALVAKLPNE
tara:strand:+ start:1249 stop:1626 length:378 start_codon:yes stop_codon:yes gene_type:complete